MWEFIDKVIYINLEHRQDRRDIMKIFFEKGQIPEDKVVRFPAISKPDGRIGATYSHAEVLNIAKQNGWKNVLICEDDLEWTDDFEEGYKMLEEYVKFPNWHVIMLLGWYVKYDFPRVMMAGNAGCYLVNSSYYDVLLANRRWSIRNMEGFGKFMRSFASLTLDVAWCQLMKIHNWYGINPCLCRQKNTFSDISKITYNASGVTGIHTGRGNLFEPIQNAQQEDSTSGISL